MNEQSARSIYKQRIDSLTDSLLPNGGGTLSVQRLRYALDQVAQVAFSTGQNYALSSLMTADEVAEQLGVSVRRVRAIAKVRHSQFGIGYQVPKTSQWLFRPSEIELLRPGKRGRPRKSKE